MTRRERQARTATRLRTALALTIITAILAILPSLFLKAAHFFDALPPDDPLTRLSRWQILAIDAAVLLMTFPLALATRRESRTDTVSDFLDEQSRVHTHGPDQLAMRIVLAVACLGLFQGEFLLIDAVKDALLRLRLTGTDRTRAATILAQLHAKGELVVVFRDRKRAWHPIDVAGIPNLALLSRLIDHALRTGA